MAILHNELNPRIFDEKGNMRENIRGALLKIVQEFLNKLNQNEIPISVVDYRLVGSNAAYNYSAKSDMDIHIIADLSIFRENEKLLQLLYDYFKSNFNDKYDIKVKGMEVELYIEDASKGSISNGVYSIKEDKWIKKPKHTTVLDIDITKSQQYQDLYKQYQELKDDEVDDFIDNLYVIRKVSLSKNGEFGDGNLIFKAFRDNGYLDDLKTRQAEIKSKELSLESLEEAVSPQGYAPKKTGKAYKVFKVKNGKLYPPMVANAGGKDTPIGVWLDAEEGEFAGLSKTGRPKVKSTGGEPLAYRPGWHLGDIPRAKQFDRLNKQTGEYEFPKDFVWAECDYAMDVDYQPESDAQGYMRTKRDEQGNVITYKSDKYQHSLAGLPKLPKDGYYKYRTNPNPDTVPWVITGQMKVNRLLSDDEVNAILKKNGIAPIHRQGGDKSLGELGLQEALEVDKIKLAPEQDRRRKLTDEDKEEIRRLYATGFHSLNSLAKQFGVSKKLILITVNPESKAKNDERIKNHWKDYYDTQEHTSAMRDTRAYKKDLLDKGELKKVDESCLTEVYLYRGVTDRSFSNHNKPYAGLFYGIKKSAVKGWGDVKKYQLVKNAKIYNAESSDAFCNNGGFYDKSYKELGRCFDNYFGDLHINKLRDFTNLSQEQKQYLNDRVEKIAGNQFCWYDLWTWCSQLIARIELEKQGYDGAKWDFEDWGTHTQYQIWNNDVVVPVNESYITEVYPNKGESKKDFISRFMSATKDEYPDQKQRYAVANSYWDRRNKKRVNESNDADPQSIIAYHSSPNKFTKFDKKYIDTATSDGGMYGKGFYFADKELAQQFNYSGYLYKVKLLFSKPYILNTDKDRETFEALINAHYDSKTKKNNSDLTDFFNAGYDGVISNNEIWKDELGNKEKIHSQFVVYDPSQITILSIEPYSLDDNYSLNEEKQEIIRAYHGSQQSNLQLTSKPIYLTNDRDLAIEFAEGYAFNYDLYDEDAPTLYTMKVKFNNPMVIKTEEEYDDLMDIVNIEETVELLKANNQDGIIYRDEEYSDVVYYMPIDASKQCVIIKEESVESINESLIVEARADQDRFREWLRDDLTWEDANDYFDLFLKLKSRIKTPYSDMYWWMKNSNQEDFAKYMDDLVNEVEDKRDIKRKEQSGARLVYQDKDWKVYEITNYEASAKYGKGTKWCIAGSKRWNNGESGAKYFNDYYSQKGIKFYYFINGNEKYALALYPDKETFEIYNAEDVQVSYIPDAPVIDEIGVNYYEKNDMSVLINAMVNRKVRVWTTVRAIEDLLYETDGKRLEIYDPDGMAQLAEEYAVDGYYEYQAVEIGDMTPEEYKEITGEEFNDDYGWGGDVPLMAWAMSFPLDFRTTAESIDPDNYRDYQYWVVSDFDGEVDIVGCHDWIELLDTCAYYSDWKTKEFLQKAAEQLIEDIKHGEIHISEIENIGLSQEFLDSLKS